MHHIMKKQDDLNVFCKKWYKKEWLYLLPAFIWIAIITVTTVLWSDNRVSSDWSAELILARELLREKKLITSNWCYSTEIRILYTQLFAMPLFKLFHSWDVIRALQGFLLHIVLLFSYCFCMKPLQLPAKYVYLSSGILFIPFSLIYIDIVQMGQSYQPHMILSFFLVGIYLRLLKKKSVVFVMLFLILSFICGLSGIRYLQILQIPLLLTAVLSYLRYKTNITLPIFSFIIAAIGYWINEKKLHQLFAFGSYQGVQFADFEENNILEMLGDKISDFFILFGYVGGVKAISFAGICNLIAIMITVILIWVVYLVGKERKKLEDKENFLFTFFVISLFINTFVFLILDHYYTSRYYILVIFWLAPILALLGKTEVRKGVKPVIGLALAVSLSLTGINTLKTIADNDQNADRKAVGDFLEENNLEFGYATLWNADVITKPTDGEVEVVSISGCDPLKVYDWLMPKRYFDTETLKETDGDQIFLLLSFDEFDLYRESRVVKEAGEPIYCGNEFMVFCYNKDEFWQDNFFEN